MRKVMSNLTPIKEVNITFTDSKELVALITRLKQDPKLSVTNSSKKFSNTPRKYHIYYSKVKMLIKVANIDGSVHDLVDKVIKIYDKVSMK